MKIRTMLALTAGIAASGPASANYQGLTVQLHSIVNVGGGPKLVFRVYASFCNPDDYAVAVVGSPTYGTLTLKNVNAFGTGPGSGFYNPGGGGSDQAPYSPDGILEWGTFATIGVPLGIMAPSSMDLTTLSPGFPTFISGTTLTNNNMGWFTPGPAEQGRAGWTGDGDAALRVLLMQLTINAGEAITGTVAVNVYNADSSSYATYSDQWLGLIPAPAGIATLGIACIIGQRRRRASF